MTVSVCAARWARTCGVAPAKLGTPLEIASTPVIAEQPDANAVNMSSSVSDCTDAGTALADGICAAVSPPTVAARTTPKTSINP